MRALFNSESAGGLHLGRQRLRHKKSLHDLYAISPVYLLAISFIGYCCYVPFDCFLHLKMWIKIHLCLNESLCNLHNTQYKIVVHYIVVITNLTKNIHNTNHLKSPCISSQNNVWHDRFWRNEPKHNSWIPIKV